MSAFLGKDKLVFDANAMAESDNIGAFVRASDGTLITHTDVGSQQALDVYIAGAAGQYAEDTSHQTDAIGNFILGVRNDTNTTLTTTNGDYSPIAVDEFGRLKVQADLTITSDFVYAEDIQHQNGDLGAFTLGVVQASLLASVTTDGDYGAFKLDNRGAMWVAPIGTAADDAVDSEAPVKIGSQSFWGALTTVSTDKDRANLISDKYRRAYVNNGANIAMLATPVSVTATAAALLTASLAGRRQVLVQNLGNKAIYIGSSAVTATDGFRVAAGATITLELGQDVAVWAVADTGATNACRVLELA